MMNPDGSEQVNLTQHRATDLGAVWSPSGEQILFVSDRQGTRVRDLYLMDPDGKNVRRVFKKKTTDWRGNATWSPDGKHFAYWLADWDRLKFGLYLGTFGEEMPNTSGILIPLRGLRMVQKSPALNLVNWGIDLRLLTSTHEKRNNRYLIKHSAGNSVRLGLLRVTDLPLLGTSIRYL